MLGAAPGARSAKAGRRAGPRRAGLAAKQACIRAPSAGSAGTSRRWATASTAAPVSRRVKRRSRAGGRRNPAGRAGRSAPRVPLKPVSVVTPVSRLTTLAITPVTPAVAAPEDRTPPAPAGASRRGARRDLAGQPVAPATVGQGWPAGRTASRIGVFDDAALAGAEELGQRIARRMRGTASKIQGSASGLLAGKTAAWRWRRRPPVRVRRPAQCSCRRCAGRWARRNRRPRMQSQEPRPADRCTQRP